MWEDEANKNGGRWALRINKGYANKLWEDLILAFIGEQFECENEITGIIIQSRPNQDTISIWNRHGHDKVVVEKIRNDLVRILGLSPDIKMDYTEFNTEAKPQAQAAEQKYSKGEKIARQKTNEGPMQQ